MKNRLLLLIFASLFFTTLKAGHKIDSLFYTEYNENAKIISSRKEIYSYNQDDSLESITVYEFRDSLKIWEKTSRSLFQYYRNSLSHTEKIYWQSFIEPNQWDTWEMKTHITIKNEQGQIIRMVGFRNEIKEGVLAVDLSRMIGLYDAKGRLVFQQVLYFKYGRLDSSRTTIEQLSYDRKDRVKKIITKAWSYNTHQMEWSRKKHFSYRKAGRYVKETEQIYFVDEHLWVKSDYKSKRRFNKMGQVVRYSEIRERYKRHITKKENDTYVYDSKGNLLEEDNKTYQWNSVELSTDQSVTRYKYNSLGQRIEEINLEWYFGFNYLALISKVSSEYDPSGMHRISTLYDSVNHRSEDSWTIKNKREYFYH